MLLTVIITHTSVENKSRFRHFYFVLENGQCFQVDSKEVLIQNDGNAVEECCVNTRAMEYAIHICAFAVKFACKPAYTSFLCPKFGFYLFPYVNLASIHTKRRWQIIAEYQAWPNVHTTTLRLTLKQREHSLNFELCQKLAISKDIQKSKRFLFK